MQKSASPSLVCISEDVPVTIDGLSGESWKKSDLKKTKLSLDFHQIGNLD